ADHCLRKHRAIVDLDKTPLSGQTAPREQLAGRQSIPPRRRRYLPPPIVALAHDPALLFQRPTTPGTSLDHLKSRHLRHSRMISHTPMSPPPHPSHKAVLSAGIPNSRRSISMAFRSIRKAMEPNSLVSRRNEVVPFARVRVRESTIVTVGNLGAFAF